MLLLIFCGCMLHEVCGETGPTSLINSRGESSAEEEKAENSNAVMDSNSTPSRLTTHRGGCHCGAITWKVEAPNTLTAWKCNCSNCSMRGNTHFIVPSQNFHLLTGQSSITTYTFGTHTAKHTFCKVCGVTSFYTPRSNPDGVAVTLACVDPGTVSHVEIRSFDGQKWEDSYSQTGISACSKLSI